MKDCSPEEESSMKSVLLRKNENCRGIHLPERRKEGIRKRAERIGMLLPQAMSLRRQYIRLQSKGYKSVSKMGLGSDQGMTQNYDKGAQAYSATVEDNVPRLLIDNGIGFLDEEAQTTTYVKGVLTPDFLLTSPITINFVNWIEATTFYAAGSITSKKIPLGKIPAKMDKYFELYGDGAVYLFFLTIRSRLGRGFIAFRKVVLRERLWY
jgi:hypothetical protein